MRIKLDHGAKIPHRAHMWDGGLDLFAKDSKTVPARGSACFDTGLHIELPPMSVGFIKSKSGLNVKHGITGEGVIDHGYTGSIVVKLYNNDRDSKLHFFEKGDKLIQLLIVPIETPELELVENVADLYGGETERGDNGFGSSGR
jgi:dUTP pyrophosphatase